METNVFIAATTEDFQMLEKDATKGTKLKALICSMHMRVGYTYYLKHYVKDQADDSWDTLAMEILYSVVNNMPNLMQPEPIENV